ncbi:Flagellar assembly protein FliH [Thalassocella blandensis]|nr:Flagellar assembly protein FliH [Thalassocella blandensis]
MTTKNKQSDRIPFESLTEDQPVVSWSLPEMHIEGKRVVRSAKKDKQSQSKNNANELVEDYKGPVKPKPLTVDEIMKMAEEAKKEGYEQGYNEGLNKGLQDGQAKGLQDGKHQAYTENKQQLEDEIARLNQIGDALFQPMQEQDAQLEEIIVDMAMQFASELINSEIKQTPQHLFNVINQALAALPVGAKNIAVYLNEQDAILVQGNIPKQQRSWIIKVDNTIKTGGCRVETLETLIDYTVEKRLQDFLAQVKERGEVSEQDVPPVRAQRDSTPSSENESELSSSEQDAKKAD